MAKRRALEAGEIEHTGGGSSDPLLAAVIDKLPSHGPWAQADREAWLKMLTLALDVAYGSSSAETPAPPPTTPPPGG